MLFDSGKSEISPVTEHKQVRYRRSILVELRSRRSRRQIILPRRRQVTCVVDFKRTLSSLCVQEVLAQQAEEFVYSTAADRRVVRQLEEKRQELERVVASSDIVGESTLPSPVW